MNRQIKRQEKAAIEGKTPIKSKATARGNVPRVDNPQPNINDNKCTHVILAPSVVSQSTDHDDGQNQLVPRVADNLVEDPHYEGIFFSDASEEGEEDEEEIMAKYTNKNRNKNISYSASPHTTSYDTPTTLNASNNEFSVCIDLVDNTTSTPSYNTRNNIETLSSRRICHHCITPEYTESTESKQL